MRIEAKARLLADESSRQKERAVDNKVDELNKQIDNIQKGLPSKFNKMKVSPENQIQKRKQVLDLKQKIQDLRQEKLRYKG